MRKILLGSVATGVMLAAGLASAGEAPTDGRALAADGMRAIQLADQSGTEGTTAVPNVTDQQVRDASGGSASHPSKLEGSNVRGVNAPHPLFTDEEQETIAKRPPLPSPTDNKLPMQQTFFFEFDSAELTQTAEVKARGLAGEIKQLRPVKVIIDGHTDTVGTEPYNAELSEDRAETVKQALMKFGVSEYLIITHAFGESDTRVPTGDEVRLQKNRRVKVKVVQ